GGNVTSLIPPRPGESILFDCTQAIADELPNALRDLGHRIIERGTTQRLHSHARVETIIDKMPDGREARRIVTHAGLANAAAFELVLPSDQELTARLPNPPSAPRHRVRAVHRRRAAP